MRQVLSIIDVLSNMIQDKNATLWKSVVILKSIITSVESSRTTESFIEIWQSLRKFTDDNGILMYTPYQALGLFSNLKFNYLSVYIILIFI